MPRKVEHDTTGTYKRGNIWWYSVTVSKGITKCFSSESTDRDTAIRKRASHLQRIAAGQSSQEPSNVTISLLLDEYLRWLERQKKPDASGVKQRLNSAGNVRDWFGHLKASRLKTSDTIAYREHRKAMLNNKGLSISDTTVNRELSYLRAAFYHAKDDLTPPLVLVVPKFDIVKLAEENNVRTGYLPDDKFPVIRDLLPEDIRLLFVCAYYTGMRVGELLKLEWYMLDFDDRMMNLPGKITKNGKPRDSPILYGDMLSWLKGEKSRRDSLYPYCTWVFTRGGAKVKNFRATWAKVTAEAGIPGLMFHDLRRTAVKNMERDGVDQRMRKLISGHRTNSMEERYNFRDKEEVRRIRDTIEQSRGLAPAPPTANGKSDIEKQIEALSEEKKILLEMLLKQLAS